MFQLAIMESCEFSVLEWFQRRRSWGHFGRSGALESPARHGSGHSFVRLYFPGLPNADDRLLHWK